VGFFGELRERRMVQILLSYGAVGWIFLEASSQMVERGVLPEVVYRLVLLWFVMGLPAVLLIGWHHGEKGKQKAPASEWVILTILALAALGFSGSTVSSHYSAAQLAASAENTLEMRRVAVAYFEDRSGGDYQYLADALTEDLIAELSQVSILDVVSRNGTLPFRDSGVGPDSIGRLLQAGTVVEGSVDIRRDRVRVNISVVDAQSGTTIQRTNLERSVDDPLAMRESVVEETSRLLRGWIGNEVRVRQGAQATSSPQAWLQTQRAEKARKDAEALLRQQDFDGAMASFAHADEMLAEAQRLDPDWPEPPTQRAAIRYRSARLKAGNADAALQDIRAGMQHADEALRRSRTYARALEMRGSLSYLHWLFRVEPDPVAQEALLTRGRADLEAAVQYDRTLATAHATLSHLYGATESTPDAALSARLALEADAYLETADAVMWRLYNASEALQQFDQARRFCDQASRRFPSDYRFANCSLRVMYLPGSAADVDRAWDLLARLDTLTPPPDREFEMVRGEFIVAAILARAGLQDSARAVLGRATAKTADVDGTGELLPIRAFATLLVGDRDGAVDLLTRAATVDAQLFASRGEIGWYWRDLQDHPRFRRLAGLN
jgi:TolB-like protein